MTSINATMLDAVLSRMMPTLVRAHPWVPHDTWYGDPAWEGALPTDPDGIAWRVIRGTGPEMDFRMCRITGSEAMAAMRESGGAVVDLIRARTIEALEALDALFPRPAFYATPERAVAHRFRIGTRAKLRRIAA